MHVMNRSARGQSAAFRRKSQASFSERFPALAIVPISCACLLHLAPETSGQRILLSEVTINTTTGLSFQSATGISYRLQWSSSPSSEYWSDVDEVIYGTGGMMTAFDPGGYDGQKGYRVVPVHAGAPPPTGGLIRASHVGLSNDTTMLDNLAQRGMNGAIVSIGGHLWDPGSGTPVKQQLTLGSNQVAVLELWQTETHARGMDYWPMLEWYGTGDRARWSVDEPYVNRFGTSFPNTPCPLNTTFWDTKITRWCVQVALWAASKPNIAGILIDTEMYGGDLGQYPDACFCTDCLQQVAGHLGIPAGALALGTASGLQRYRDAAVELVALVSRTTYDAIQAVIPGLDMGGYVFDFISAEGFVPSYYIGITVGWGEAGNPSLIFSEKTYGTGWFTCWRPSNGVGFPFQCSTPDHVLQHRALLAGWNAHAEFVLGLRINGIPDEHFAETIYHAAINTRGFWLYDGLMLGDNSLWVLPGGGQPAYLQALADANAELDHWEAVNGMHFARYRFRPYDLIP